MAISAHKTPQYLPNSPKVKHFQFYPPEPPEIPQAPQMRFKPLFQPQMNISSTQHPKSLRVALKCEIEGICYCFSIPKLYYHFKTLHFPHFQPHFFILESAGVLGNIPPEFFGTTKTTSNQSPIFPGPIFQIQFWRIERRRHQRRGRAHNTRRFEKYKIKNSFNLNLSFSAPASFLLN